MYQPNAFFKNISKILTGGLIAQSLNFLSLPLISIWYLPSDFGEYATFILFISLLPLVMSLRMEMAIMQNPEESEKRKLIFLSFINSLIILILSLFLSFLLDFQSQINVLIIVLCSFMITLQNIGVALCNLNEQYWNISIFKIMYPTGFFVSAFLIKDLDVLYPLAVSHLIITAICTLYILKVSNFKLNYSCAKEVKKTFFKNFSYIKYDLPSNLLNVAALLLPAFLISKFYNDDLSGLYFLAYKMLSAPISALSMAVGYVYRREAVKEFQLKKTFDIITNKTVYVLVSTSFLMLLIFYTVGDVLFDTLFEDDWNRIYPVISILIPMFAIKLVASTLSFSFYVVGKMDLDLYGQLLFLVSIISSIYSGYLIDDFWFSIYALSVSSSFIYLMYGYKSIMFSKGRFL